MEARCYRGGDNRTKMKETVIGKREYVATFFIILYMVAVAATRYI